VLEQSENHIEWYKLKFKNRLPMLWYDILRGSGTVARAIRVGVQPDGSADGPRVGHGPAWTAPGHLGWMSFIIYNFSYLILHGSGKIAAAIRVGVQPDGSADGPRVGHGPAGTAPGHLVWTSRRDDKYQVISTKKQITTVEQVQALNYLSSTQCVE
jgi:hypothetical protein